MAYTFSTASSRYLTTSSTPLTAAPLTLAAWFNFPSTGANQAIAGINSVGVANTNSLRLVVNNLNQVTAVTNAGANASSATPAATAGIWNHGCAVFAASNSRTAYLNGVAATANTSAFTPVSLSAIFVGANINGSTVAGQANGSIAEIGFWNIALSNAEIGSLASGVSPLLIRPQSLVFCAPLVRDLTDVRGGLPLTNVNGATVSAHPRVYA